MLILFFRRLGEIAKLWEQLEVEKIIEQEATSDTTDFEVLKLTQSDIELDDINNKSTKNKNNKKERKYTENPEDEQEITPKEDKKSSKRVARSLADSQKSASSSNLNPAEGRFNLQRQPTYTGEESDDSYDESSDSEDETKDENAKKPISLQELLNTPDIKEKEPEKVKKLREMSKGNQNLHNLLKKDTSSIEPTLLIEILKASLKKEGQMLKSLKRQNEYLICRYKNEKESRIQLEVELKNTKKQINRCVM